MLEAYQAYELGRRSAEQLVQTLEEVLCCPGSRGRDCYDVLAKLSPFLAGADDCDSLEYDLEPYFAWLSLRWAYRPCGPPPSSKKRLVLRALCNTRPPVPEELFKQVLGERFGEGEEI